MKYRNFSEKRALESITLIFSYFTEGGNIYTAFF